MVRNVRCIAVETTTQLFSRLGSRQESFDLLPWADPYIAQLVENLRAEATPPIHDDHLDLDVPSRFGRASG